MSILIYSESQNGKVAKSAKELASYAKAYAGKTGEKVIAVGVGLENPDELFQYGVDKVLNVTADAFQNFNAYVYAGIIAEAAEQNNAGLILVSDSNDSVYLAPLLATQLDAGYVSQVISLPLDNESFTVKRKVFSNKGIAFTEILTEKKLLRIAKNSFGLVENPVEGNVEEFNPSVNTAVYDEYKVVNVEKTTGKISLTDADIIVSAGRGLKGPENWGMIEELAEVLGAATACSKPVADIGWRPHAEHVGQTGKQVAPNLYLAVGISGAIQHLAGVNSSKYMVVINNDPEAPFFKAADYGVVGDAFEVVPKLIEKLKAFKNT
jgi:electron transfer flavoprotein alpha subunit